MFEIIKAIIYGIIQGISEWLPISSTGHLILLEQFLPLKVFDDALANQEFMNMFLVVIQFGSILAVILLYFKDLWPFKKERAERLKTWRLYLLIIVGAIPAAIIGLLIDDYLDALFYNVLTIAWTLIFYGVLFIVIENLVTKVRVNQMEKLSLKDALKVGFFQILALIPGTSRSGATILGARAIGIDRATSAKYSFFLAIPVMLGASLLKIIKLKVALDASAISILLTGVITAFVISFFVIKFLMNYIRKHDFKVFGYYRVVLGLILFLYLFIGA